VEVVTTGRDFELYFFSLAVLDIPKVSEMYHHFTIISETENTEKVICEG
jgi:hypothetical protein